MVAHIWKQTGHILSSLQTAHRMFHNAEEMKVSLTKSSREILPSFNVQQTLTNSNIYILFTFLVVPFQILNGDPFSKLWWAQPWPNANFNYRGKHSGMAFELQIATTHFHHLRNLHFFELSDIQMPDVQSYDKLLKAVQLEVSLTSFFKPQLHYLRCPCIS